MLISFGLQYLYSVWDPRHAVAQRTIGVVSRKLPQSIQWAFVILFLETESHGDMLRLVEFLHPTPHVRGVTLVHTIYTAEVIFLGAFGMVKCGTIARWLLRSVRWHPLLLRYRGYIR